MGTMKNITCDVAVVGGGPAGVSACIELARLGHTDVYLFENEARLGGIPRSAHVFFGMRDMHRAYSGPAYARRLETLVRRTAVKVCTQSTVISIEPGSEEQRHVLTVSGPEEIGVYHCRHVILATGCFESSRGSRLLCGLRPAGVMTTGTLQKTVNLEKLTPGRRAVILGSEHVAFSAAMTLHRAGVRIAALVEPDTALHTYPSVAAAIGGWLRFPILRQCRVLSVYGHDRVTGVRLAEAAGRPEQTLDCDTLVVTGAFRPEATLIYDSAIEIDPCSGGPVVDAALQTPIRGIWAAGNVLRGALMHDLCALEGRRAARGVAAQLAGASARPGAAALRIVCQRPIRLVTPQLVAPSDAAPDRLPWLGNGYFFQVSQTLHQAVVRAMVGDRCLWKQTYRRLIGANPYRLPVERFESTSIDRASEIHIVCDDHAV